MITHACVKFYTKPQSYDNEIVPSMCYTIPCHRHGDAFIIIAQFIDTDEIDKTKTEQGFLTHDGIFLTRIQARLHAIECGQIDESIRVLYSEDLW
jgi:hypothetical protein